MLWRRKNPQTTKVHIVDDFFSLPSLGQEASSQNPLDATEAGDRRSTPVKLHLFRKSIHWNRWCDSGSLWSVSFFLFHWKGRRWFFPLLKNDVYFVLFSVEISGTGSIQKNLPISLKYQEPRTKALVCAKMYMRPILRGRFLGVRQPRWLYSQTCWAIGGLI